MLLASAEYSFYLGERQGPRLSSKGRSVCPLCQKVNLTEMVMTEFTNSSWVLEGGWTNQCKKYVKWENVESSRRIKILLVSLRPVFRHLIVSCEATCLHQIKGVQDLPQTLSFRWSSCLQGFFPAYRSSLFWELGSCKIVFQPSPSEGTKLHGYFGRELVSGCSFHLGFWFASKLTQPLKKIKESQHDIVFCRTPFGQPQIIIRLLYFVRPFLPLPCLLFLLYPKHFYSFPPCLLFPRPKWPQSRICSCNDITLQRNGYFSLNVLSALRELGLLSPSTHRDVSIEHQLHLWAFAAYLGVTLHQRLCF